MDKICPILKERYSDPICRENKCAMWRYFWKHSSTQREKIGYCGLAGKPELLEEDEK